MFQLKDSGPVGGWPSDSKLKKLPEVTVSYSMSLLYMYPVLWRGRSM